MQRQRSPGTEAMWQLVKATFTKFCASRGSRVLTRAELSHVLKKLEPDAWTDEALARLMSPGASDGDSVDCIHFVDWLFSNQLHGNFLHASLQSSSRKAWVNHAAGKITYVTDVEGHWEYFCSFVEQSEGLSFVDRGINPKEARSALELELKDGWHFVFGGDSCDKGPGSLRFIGSLLALKKNYPGRVHLVMGNRDINKIRFTAELDDEEIARLSPATPGAYWVREKDRVTPWHYLQNLAAIDHGIPVEEVSRETLMGYNTKANRLRYHLKCDMGSDGEFDFRRQELAIMAGVASEDIDDEQVVNSYVDTWQPNGLFGEFVRNGQLACFLDGSLIVHGQLIGSDFPCSEDGTAESVRVVPGHDAGEERRVEDLCEWVVQLNDWYHSQIDDWAARPRWETPPMASSFQSWVHRGGSGLIAYGTPATPWPSVVYCRWLEKNSMPRLYPPELTSYLLASGVRRVIVGHTPHGNCPTVIWNDGLPVVMADTSYSAMKSNFFFRGDNRGDAVGLLHIEGDTCVVKGRTGGAESKEYDYEVTARGSCHVGRIISGSMLPVDSPVGMNANKPFFVKAKLCGGQEQTPQILACSIDGFLYTYVTHDERELTRSLEGPQVCTDCGAPAIEPLELLRRCTVNCAEGKCFQQLCSSGQFFGASENASDSRVVEEIFNILDPDHDGAVTKGELKEALLIPCLKNALLFSIPMFGETTDFESMFDALDVDHDGRISLDEFLTMFRSATPKIQRIRK